MQVAHAELDDFGTGGVAEEEGHFGVFVQLGCFLVECALAAGVFGFAVRREIEVSALALGHCRGIEIAHICLNIMMAVLCRIMCMKWNKHKG